MPPKKWGESSALHNLLAIIFAKDRCWHHLLPYANMVIEEESEEESSSDESVSVKPVVAPRKKFDDEEDSDDVRSLNARSGRTVLTRSRLQIIGKRKKTLK